MPSTTPSSPKPLTILSVGCGNMGEALLKIFLHHQPTPHIIAISQKQKNIRGIIWHSADAPLPTDISPDIILLAIKPQIADATLPKYQTFSSALFISIMAGKPMDDLEKILGQNKKIIRAMPNLLVKVKKGFTSYCTNQHCHDDDEDRFQKLFLPSGAIEKISHQDDYDMMASLFGCAPGFLLAMAAMIQKTAGNQTNINDNQLKKIIQNMFIGSMEIADDDKASFSSIAQQVASRGGMTEAGLKILENQQSGFTPLWEKTINAATQQAKELAK
ncbi:MAG: pyrroline-5-carboxylate reductase family protein [Alphaproteobacteria bacterium]